VGRKATGLTPVVQDTAAGLPSEYGTLPALPCVSFLFGEKTKGDEMKATYTSDSPRLLPSFYFLFDHLPYSLFGLFAVYFSGMGGELLY
jgi:hypothetical protein